VLKPTPELGFRLPYPTLTLPHFTYLIFPTPIYVCFAVGVSGIAYYRELFVVSGEEVKI
jgi:hypothetical protein